MVYTVQAVLDAHQLPPQIEAWARAWLAWEPLTADAQGAVTRAWIGLGLLDDWRECLGDAALAAGVTTTMVDEDGGEFDASGYSTGGTSVWDSAEKALADVVKDPLGSWGEVGDEAAYQGQRIKREVAGEWEKAKAFLLSLLKDAEYAAVALIAILILVVLARRG